MNLIPWRNFCWVLTQLIVGKQCDVFYQAKSSPFYILIKQKSLIDISEINKHSNSISIVGTNKPIIIMEYD